MTFISNDPIFWPLIAAYRVYRYYVATSSIVVIYDWMLNFGQEFDLVLRQRWSFITLLYVTVRYIGLLQCSVLILTSCGSEVYFTDSVSTILLEVVNWMSVAANSLVWVIMLIRIYAMYQKSRMILIPLTFLCSAFTISCVAITVLQDRAYPAEEFIFSGNHLCAYEGNSEHFIAITAILRIVWEVLTLCLAIWVAIKHFREMPTGWNIKDCFTVLIKSHVLYFASFVVVGCLTVGQLSPSLNTESMSAQHYGGILQIFYMMQTYMLAPCLILSLRQYHAKVVAESDEATAMTSIAFQQRTQMSNSNDV